MKRFTLLLLCITLFGTICPAQTSTQQDVKLDLGGGIKQITSDDGSLSFSILGMQYNIGSDKPSSKNSQIRIRLTGLSSKNHIALMELGSNFLVGTDYSMYSKEQQDNMTFTTHKSIYVAINPIQVNIALNPKRTLAISAAAGITMENYCFANNVTLQRENGMMQPISIDHNTKKSKLRATYFHLPVVLDYNLKSGFFISAGLNFDVLMSSALKYKTPKYKERGTTTLNPVQVGVTARIGWRQLYFFANYSFIDMFKMGTGPKGNRMSVGAGLFF